MAHSLRTRIRKLVYDGKITRQESDSLIKKLDGHDKRIRADALDEMITHIKACENEAFDNVEPLIGSVLMAIRCKAEQLKERK